MPHVSDSKGCRDRALNSPFATTTGTATAAAANGCQSGMAAGDSYALIWGGYMWGCCSPVQSSALIGIDDALWCLKPVQARCPAARPAHANPPAARQQTQPPCQRPRCRPRMSCPGAWHPEALGTNRDHEETMLPPLAAAIRDLDSWPHRPLASRPGAVQGVRMAHAAAAEYQTGSAVGALCRALRDYRRVLPCG